LGDDLTPNETRSAGAETCEAPGTEAPGSVRIRAVISAGATAGLLAVILLLGGVGGAAATVHRVGDADVTVTTSTACTTDYCGSGLGLPVTPVRIASTQRTAGSYQTVRVGGNVPGDVRLTYIVENSCNGRDAEGGVALRFLSNPIAKGVGGTRFLVSRRNAPPGIYVVTVSGTSGAETVSRSFDVIVGAASHC
jgi:hypothetical protein